MSTTEKLINLEELYGAHNYHPLDIVVETAQGVWVTDVEGKRYLDCLSAYSALNQGHCHPKILATLKEQAEKVTLTSRAFRNDQLPLFCQELSAITGLERVLPMNSGAEACETAVKAARKWGYLKKGIPENQAEIVVCSNNFHGRTTTIVSFSTEEAYKKGFGPFTPGFKVIPFNDAKALEEAITPNTCAFFIEPIQAEAGILIPDDGYLQAVQAICKQNQVLFILDEIQTGMGRTGKWFAYQYESGVKPDGLTLGKALSGGFYPVSAFCASTEVMDVFTYGTHGSTFGGNPLGCAVARTAMRVLEEEKLIENSFELGQWFLGQLQQINSPLIKEVRGRGLLIGLELTEQARPYCEALKDKGMLCKETHDTVIRLAPPLVITKEDLEWALDQIKLVLAKSN